MAELFNCEEIAERYGVQVITVWDWIRKGKLKAMKIGKQYRISKNDIEEFEAKSRKRVDTNEKTNV